MKRPSHDGTGIGDLGPRAAGDDADVQLEAVFENGARVVGESHIFNAKKQQDCRIHHVSLVPEHPKALPDALEAISEADLILLGPGSLYTSVIPNLLVDGVADTIRASHAQKFYICNIMTQDGETEATPPPTIWKPCSVTAEGDRRPLSCQQCAHPARARRAIQ